MMTRRNSWRFERNAPRRQGFRKGISDMESSLEGLEDLITDMHSAMERGMKRCYDAHSSASDMDMELDDMRDDANEMGASELSSIFDSLMDDCNLVTSDVEDISGKVNDGFQPTKMLQDVRKAQKMLDKVK